MFLNDAFDAEFDRQYRTERPIPSGAISAPGVWGWGLGWLIGGWLLLGLLGGRTAVTGLVLVGTILLYDWIHKAVTLSPLLMALCRFLLYLLAAAATPHRISGWVIWSGLALALYVVGLSYIARKESARGQLQAWPAWLLAAPFLLAWVVNPDGYRAQALLLCLLLGGWIGYCLRSTYWMETVSIGRTVSGLLAGICLVDLLAVAGDSLPATLAFVALFGLALLGQRFVPAT
jgi:4-hydroxybenzoate polyprenyltransferase